MGLGITGYHRVSPKGRPGGGQNGMTGYHRVSPGITTLTGYHRVSLGITTELGITGYHRVSHGLGVSTVTEFKPPIILIYSKYFVFTRSQRLKIYELNHHWLLDQARKLKIVESCLSDCEIMMPKPMVIKNGGYGLCRWPYRKMQKNCDTNHYNPLIYFISCKFPVNYCKNE